MEQNESSLPNKYTRHNNNNNNKNSCLQVNLNYVYELHYRGRGQKRTGAWSSSSRSALVTLLPQRSLDVAQWAKTLGGKSIFSRKLTPYVHFKKNHKTFLLRQKMVHCPANIRNGFFPYVLAHCCVLVVVVVVNTKKKKQQQHFDDWLLNYILTAKI